MVKVRQSSRGVEVGKMFGSYEVIGPPFSQGYLGRYQALCRCKCGRLRVVAAADLNAGVGHCRGCNRGVPPTHGESGRTRTNLYGVWKVMRARCTNPNVERYPRYGGRGISVCDEWNEYTTFREWAMQNGYAPGLEIDRRDNDGNYEPGNCRWITKKQNSRNTSTNRLLSAFGETKCCVEWAEDHRCQVTASVFIRRISHGWDTERALTQPQRRSPRKMLDPIQPRNMGS